VWPALDQVLEEGDVDADTAGGVRTLADTVGPTDALIQTALFAGRHVHVFWKSSDHCLVQTTAPDRIAARY